MKSEMIDEINKEVSATIDTNQGIFKSPNNVSYKIKDYVIYSRSNSNDMDNHFKVLDYMIMKFCPNISYQQYRKIAKEIVTDHDYEMGWYNDRDDYVTSYLLLSDFEALVWEFSNGN